jgi:N-acetyl-1-D-myo-inositol-2-amino-2-deoxy-alpha-D-glucopyranoside deacetylase
MEAAVTRRELAVGVPASLLAGLVVGTIGTFKHQVGVSAATGTGLPVGVVLALAMVLAFLVALRLSFATRWYAAAAGIGVVGAVALLSLPGSSGGSTVILLNAAGVAWTIGPAVLAAVVVGWPRIARHQQVDQQPGGILEADRGNRVDDAKDH